MFYPPEIVSEVTARNDIVDVVSGYGIKLALRGGRYFGLCPFHGEKTPSFSVTRDMQMFYCYGCNAGGNVIGFVQRIENMDFTEALKHLADRARYVLPEKSTSPQARQQAAAQTAAREKAVNINKLAARFFYDYLHGDSLEAENARQYLEKRGITPALSRRFGLGLAPDKWDGLLSAFPDTPSEDLSAAGLVKQSEKDASRWYDRFRGRLMFPIIDHRGRIVGFGGRVLNSEKENEAKYINTPETALFHKSECLYGLNLAKKARASQLIIVEGYMDVIAMHMHGFVNTVGVLGTAMRETHARLLKNVNANTAILVLDSDEAGVRAALRAIPILTKADVKLKILELPDAKDPDEYLSRFGAAKFTNLLEEAPNHIAFQINLLHKKNDLQTTEGRVNFTQESAKILAELPSAIEIDAYVSEISKTSDISATAIKTEISKHAKHTDSHFLFPPRQIVEKKRGEDIGLKNAKKDLLHLIFTNKQAAQALKASAEISQEEMHDQFYAELLKLAFEKTFATPLEIVNLFESVDEQQAIAEIFTNAKDYPDTAAAEKALNDMVKKIKLAWLNQRMENEKNDLNTVKLLYSQIKSVKMLNISITGG